MDGYVAIINGMVTFICSPNYTRQAKVALIDAATAVANGKMKASEAAKQLDLKNKESSKLLLDWYMLGLTFVSTLASVATLVLSHHESFGNIPVEQLAMDKFDDTITSIHQPDQRIMPTLQWSVRPMPEMRYLNTPIQQSDHARSQPETPNENRKARRARINKSQLKRRK